MEVEVLGRSLVVLGLAFVMSGLVFLLPPRSKKRGWPHNR